MFCQFHSGFQCRFRFRAAFRFPWCFALPCRFISHADAAVHVPKPTPECETEPTGHPTRIHKPEPAGPETESPAAPEPKPEAETVNPGPCKNGTEWQPCRVQASVSEPAQFGPCYLYLATLACATAIRPQLECKIFSLSMIFGLRAEATAEASRRTEAETEAPTGAETKTEE